MWNAGEEEARVRWETWPSLKTGLFYETLARLAEEGRSVTAGKPNLLQMAMLMAEYDQEVRLVKPPRVLQKIVMWLLAPVGWVLGYRSRPGEEGPATPVAGDEGRAR